MDTGIKAVDFFSGAGGLTHGLIQSGIKVIAGIDIDKSCQETYERNNQGAIFLHRDMTIYSPQELEKELKIKKNDSKLVFAGCAPCQFWSLLPSVRTESKKTKDLILYFQLFVKYFKPGFVIVENVPGFHSKENSPIKEFISCLEQEHYDCEYNVLDMSYFGIPQSRKRFTLLASRVSKVLLPKPSNKRICVANVIGKENGFKEVKAGYKDNSVFLHSVAGLSEKSIKRLELTPKNGGDRRNWQNKKSLQVDCFIDDNRKFHDSYARMWWDRPAPTITTKFFSVSNGRFSHPEENRALSLREGATLQTFPKDYIFIGNTIASIARMIGNAVPPAFAKILGEQIIKSVK